MNWVKKKSLPATKATQYNGQHYIELDNLWKALHRSFNSNLNYQVNTCLLEEIYNKEMKMWVSFARKELLNTIESCNNTSTPGPDKLS